MLHILHFKLKFQWEHPATATRATIVVSVNTMVWTTGASVTLDSLEETANNNNSNVLRHNRKYSE